MTIIKRVMARQNEAVNEIWMCDKGRVGHHHSRSAERITRPMIRRDGRLVETSWAGALEAVASKLKAASGNGGPMAGPMLSNEDLWELRRLVENVGSKQLGVWPYRMTGADLTAQVGLPTGSNFKDMARGTTIIVIASDVQEEAPGWYLRLKGPRARGARRLGINPLPTPMVPHCR